MQAVKDNLPIVQALKEKRLNRAQVAHLLSLRDEMQTTPNQDAEIQEFLVYVQDMTDTNKRLEAENAALRRQLDAAIAEAGAVDAELVS